MNYTTKFTPITVEQCGQWINWVSKNDLAVMPKLDTCLQWALVYLNNGVCWGKYDQDQNRWVMGSEFFGICPSVDSLRLMEMRLFGHAQEILIWKSGNHFGGRKLSEPTQAHKRIDATVPQDERRILAGDRCLKVLGGGSHVQCSNGSEQVLPVPVTSHQLQRHRVNLWVRHYYKEDPSTGAVRLFASRCVRLEVED
ncbi:MAG: hypothetical protein HUU55_08040, partial [Myxococcales bacterium]|nr:hypothetical protein [Myxococcales bacterium]